MPRNPDDDESSSATVASSDADNDFKGTNAGNLIQAGIVQGDVNFYSSADSSMASQRVPIVSTVRIDSSSQVYMTPRGNPPWSFHVSNRTYVNVLVEAHGVQAVVLQSLRPIILSRQEPRPVDQNSRGGTIGVLARRSFGAELDFDPPRLVPLQSGVEFPLTVAANDPELLVICPTTEYETLWKLELEWVMLGRSGTLTIDDNGAPFRLHPGHNTNKLVTYQF